MNKNWNEVFFGEVVAEFKRQYPWVAVGSINVLKMRAVLNGELVPVRVSGKRAYKLLPKADTLPGGALEQHNAKVRAHNRAVRVQARANAQQFLNENPDLAKAIAGATAILKGIK